MYPILLYFIKFRVCCGFIVLNIAPYYIAFLKVTS